MVFVRSLSRKTIDSSSEHYKSAYRKIKLQHTDCPVNPKRQYEWLKALEELSAKIGQNPRLSLERYVWKDLFVECYERQNIALSRIAEALGVHVNRVHRLKKKYGIPTNSEASYQERLKHYGGSYKGLFDNRRFGRRLIDRLTPSDLRQKYLLEKNSIGDIAKEYGVSRAAVHKYLKKEGIVSRNKTEARRTAMDQGKTVQTSCNFNHQFFSKWSREMAWILGLFLTDGCLHEMPFGASLFTIHLVDIDVIWRIREHMASNQSIKIERRGKNRPLYRLDFVSQAVCNDLTRLGLSPRKSNTVKMPPVPQEFLADFVRGVFEGDGSYVIDKRNQHLRLSLASGSKDFIYQFADALSSIGFTKRVPYEYVRKGKKYFELKYGSIADCRLYYQLAYMNTPKSLTMARKRKIIEGWYSQRF